ncbi:type II toxin-antitoxin system RelE/ParE family toxin [Salmonella enterica subsp. enterica]|nr:type II toxin-antitoxin system RelE/ParE family toxin [Salmonella enterica subsp. enterica serovar Montevideo]
MSDNNTSTLCPEPGKYILAQPVERHIIYFLQTNTEINIIRILSQYQDTGRLLNWQ